MQQSMSRNAGGLRECRRARSVRRRADRARPAQRDVAARGRDLGGHQPAHRRHRRRGLGPAAGGVARRALARRLSRVGATSGGATCCSMRRRPGVEPGCDTASYPVAGQSSGAMAPPARGGRPMSRITRRRRGRVCCEPGSTWPASALIVAEALAEDLGGHGVLPPGTGARRRRHVGRDHSGRRGARGRVRRPAAGPVAGVPVAAYVVALVCRPRPARSRSRCSVDDGDDGRARRRLLRVRANTRALLRAERVALNLLTLMSGVATATRGLGAAHSRARAPGSGTPARPCPACACCRSTRSASAAGSITGCRWPTPR